MKYDSMLGAKLYSRFESSVGLELGPLVTPS
jgi:hypothetical protein